jgi:hypothetical protein
VGIVPKSSKAMEKNSYPYFSKIPLGIAKNTKIENTKKCKMRKFVNTTKPFFQVYINKAIDPFIDD